MVSLGCVISNFENDLVQSQKCFSSMSIFNCNNIKSSCTLLVSVSSLHCPSTQSRTRIGVETNIFSLIVIISRSSLFRDSKFSTCFL